MSLLGLPIESALPLDAPRAEAPRADSVRLGSHEQQLASDVARGDVAALGRLYDEYHANVRAFALRLVGEPAAAEDLVHDVFLATPRVIGRFRGEGSLRSFLLGIAANHARHHVRAASRRRAASQRLAARGQDGEVATPEHETRRSELARALQLALDALSHDHRVTFVLCELEERSAVEVAGIMGIPEATVRTRLFHAKKKLQAALSAGGFR